MKRILVCLAALFAFAAGAQAAGIIVPAEAALPPRPAQLPACDDAGVLSADQRPFRAKRNGILEFVDPPRRIRPHPRNRLSAPTASAYIPRRYCIARSVDGDGKLRPVIYDIGEDLGIIGWG